MSHRTTALTSLVVVSFVACGRLELGDYAKLPPEGSNDTSVLPPVPPSAGESSGGAASSGASGSTAPTAGSPPRPAGGAGSAREPVAGAAGEGEASGGDAAGGVAGTGGAGGEGSIPGEVGKSCKELKDSCGSSGSSGSTGWNYQSCCAMEYVSAGEFVRGGIEAGEAPAPSHVSGFYLGTFEVTVGRFLAFLGAYDQWRAGGAPRAGDGAHPRIPGSGWRTEWLRREGDSTLGLAATSAVVAKEVSLCSGVPFSTDGPLDPVNCVSFYEAAAFCIWDGGRLATDLEWEYAAAGGGENRRYPWGNDEPTQPRAAYGCFANESWLCLIPNVGSHPSGIGRFGHLDLAGSLSEWALDAARLSPPAPCSDCANLQELDRNPRSTRGGNWMSEPSELAVADNYPLPADLHLSEYGIRCAYDAPGPY